MSVMSDLTRLLVFMQMRELFYVFLILQFLEIHSCKMSMRIGYDIVHKLWQIWHNFSMNLNLYVWND